MQCAWVGLAWQFNFVANSIFKLLFDLTRTNISLINEANGGLIDLKGVEAKFLKTEMSDEAESHLGKTHGSNNGEFSQPGSKSSYASSSSSTSSLSNYNEQIKMNNQHPMNKMIFSYTQAGNQQIRNFLWQEYIFLILYIQMKGIMNDFDLVNLPLRELNKRLRSLPKQMAYNLKKRRRTLKNRKYAQNCRSKRLEQKSEMEVQNSKLKIEINRLKQMLDRAQKENLTLKSLTLKSAAAHTHCMSGMDNEGCLKAEHNISIDDTKENNQNKSSFMISAAVSNSAAFQSTNNTLNSPLTPNTPTHLNTTFNMSSGASQLTHLLSLPSSKSSDNNNNNNNNNSMNSQTSHIHFNNNNNNNHSQQSQSFSFSSKC